MNTVLDKKIAENYKQELQDTLNQLYEKIHPFDELLYFFKICENYFNIETWKDTAPKVIIMGTSVPEEIIYATGGIVPYWVTGGSFGVCAFSDDMVPRDTDPVSRSILGYLQNINTEKAIIIIPIVNDGSRKLAYILKREGKKVYTIDMPPEKILDSKEIYQRQIEECVQAVSKHIKKGIFRMHCQKSPNLVWEAKKTAKIFYETASKRIALIPASVRMMVLYSYYCTNNLTEWIQKLKELILYINNSDSNQNTGASRVLLMGSPIYFPNYKIPFLLEEVGLNIVANMDYTQMKTLHELPHSKDMKILAESFFMSDCSGAYAINKTLYHQVKNIIEKKKIDGVVYHVLKGQIEYDYELDRLEKLFSQNNIPVFRLETDYNYQDIEQLRIRMEAFCELLSQKKHQEVHRK